MTKIRVALGSAGYDIHIGQDLAENLENFLGKSPYSQRAVVIADEQVGALYGEKILHSLDRAAFKAEIYLVPVGEVAKSLQVAEKIYTRLIELGLDRKSPLIALGGGVTGDLAGFVAATYLRGVPFVQIPTSLLAQVDSSVGGKVAVNHPLGKNLIGAFYQPQAVFIDLDFLKTLPRREILTGLGEVVKYGVIYDETFFSFLEEHSREVSELNYAAALKLITRSCEIKAAVVSEDEREGGLRRILNFGHTLGHAIEQVTNFSRYNHGEAVSIGMLGAARLSEALGLSTGRDTERITALLTDLGLPMTAPGLSAEKIFAALFRDKKTIAGKINWVLMESLGRVKVTSEVPESAVKEVIADLVK